MTPSDQTSQSARNARNARNAQSARNARIAFGFALILLLFLGETIVAHQRFPQAASPIVWALLGGGAVVCVALAAWFNRAARRR